MWECIDQIRSHGINIIFNKVKAHTDEEDIIKGIITREQRVGNDHADTYAKLGAKIDEISDLDINLISWIDATAWLVQKRLLKACELSLHYTKKEEAPVPMPRTTMFDTLHGLGHELIVVGKRDHCNRCITNWHKDDRRSIIDRGRCNPDMWGMAPPLCKNVPWVVPIGKEMVFGGKTIHATHHLAWYRGILYCLRCGCYSELRVRLLSNICKMKPSGVQAAHGLKRMKEGLHPVSGKPQAHTREIPPSYVESAGIDSILADIADARGPGAGSSNDENQRQV